MIYDLNAIFQNGPTDIQEQIDVLNNTIEAIKNIKTQLESTGYYCSECGRWYRQDDCSLREKSYTTLVCTNPFQGYLDPYEYEERTVHEWYDVCPEGHSISEKPRFRL